MVSRQELDQTSSWVTIAAGPAASSSGTPSVADSFLTTGATNVLTGLLSLTNIHQQRHLVPTVVSEHPFE